MGEEDCCQNCAEIITRAEKAAEFAENITKSANDISKTSEQMSIHAREVVNICEGEEKRIYSRPDFLKHKNVAPKEDALVIHKNLEKEKTWTPAALFTKKVDLYKSIGKKSGELAIDAAKELDEAGEKFTKVYVSSLGDATNKIKKASKISESLDFSSSAQSMATENVESNELGLNVIDNIEEPNSSSMKISKHSIKSIIEKLEQSRKVVTDMKGCCEDSTARFSELLDEAYRDVELLKDGLTSGEADILSRENEKITPKISEKIHLRVSMLKEDTKEKAQIILNGLKSRETICFVGGVVFGIGVGYIIGLAYKRDQSLNNENKSLPDNTLQIIKKP